MASKAGRHESPYKLDFTNGLPPGTDTYEQFEENPRLPRPAPQLTRPTPQWPPLEERQGKWLSKYLDQLDPETEYDHIIRTALMFGGSDFGTALGYAAVFCILTQAPSGAIAIHGGKVIRRGHQRYYETQLMNLHWVYHGSSAPETISHIEQVNKLHSGVWKRHPGTISAPWEGQMAIIALSYFETWVRKTVGARNQEPHPAIKAAYPAWGERVTGHFVTETNDGSRSMGLNYPRTWDELEKFFYWFDEFPFNQQRTPSQKQKGHETSEAFVDQFCELWFPRPLKFVGRHVLLTFIPPNCRQTQGLGEPNLFISGLTKLFMKTVMDIQDYLSDPVQPSLLAFREFLIQSDLSAIDRLTKQQRDTQDKYLILLLPLFLITAVAGFYRLCLS